MPETGTVVGIAIAGVAVVGAAVVLGVALTSKNGAEKVTTIIKKGPRAWVNPWYYWDYPVFVGNAGYYGGYERVGGGHGGYRHGGGHHGGGGHVH